MTRIFRITRSSCGRTRRKIIRFIKTLPINANASEVTNEGNVVPWIMATDVVIHNGCTTGVEAYMMGVPAVSYRAKINETYDMGFYRLPNLISHQCFDVDQLQETLKKIIKGELGAANGDDRRSLVKQYLAAQDGPLACERIVDVLEKRWKVNRNYLNHLCAIVF